MNNAFSTVHYAISPQLKDAFAQSLSKVNALLSVTHDKLKKKAFIASEKYNLEFIMAIEKSYKIFNLCLNEICHHLSKIGLAEFSQTIRHLFHGLKITSDVFVNYHLIFFKQRTILSYRIEDSIKRLTQALRAQSATGQIYQTPNSSPKNTKADHVLEDKLSDQSLANTSASLVNNILDTVLESTELDAGNLIDIIKQKKIEFNFNINDPDLIMEMQKLIHEDIKKSLEESRMNVNMFLRSLDSIDYSDIKATSELNDVLKTLKRTLKKDVGQTAELPRMLICESDELLKEKSGAWQKDIIEKFSETTRKIANSALLLGGKYSIQPPKDCQHKGIQTIIGDNTGDMIEILNDKLEKSEKIKKKYVQMLDNKILELKDTEMNLASINKSYNELVTKYSITEKNLDRTEKQLSRVKDEKEKYFKKLESKSEELNSLMNKLMQKQEKTTSENDRFYNLVKSNKDLSEKIEVVNQNLMEIKKKGESFHTQDEHFSKDIFDLKENIEKTNHEIEVENSRRGKSIIDKLSTINDKNFIDKTSSAHTVNSLNSLTEMIKNRPSNQTPVSENSKSPSLKTIINNKKNLLLQNQNVKKDAVNPRTISPNKFSPQKISLEQKTNPTNPTNSTSSLAIQEDLKNIESTTRANNQQEFNFVNKDQIAKVLLNSHQNSQSNLEPGHSPNKKINNIKIISTNKMSKVNSDSIGSQNDIKIVVDLKKRDQEKTPNKTSINNSDNLINTFDFQNVNNTQSLILDDNQILHNPGNINTEEMILEEENYAQDEKNASNSFCGSQNKFVLNLKNEKNVPIINSEIKQDLPSANVGGPFTTYSSNLIQDIKNENADRIITSPKVTKFISPNIQPIIEKIEKNQIQPQALSLNDITARILMEYKNPKEHESHLLEIIENLCRSSQVHYLEIFYRILKENMFSNFSDFVNKKTSMLFSQTEDLHAKKFSDINGSIKKISDQKNSLNENYFTSVITETNKTSFESPHFDFTTERSSINMHDEKNVTTDETKDRESFLACGDNFFQKHHSEILLKKNDSKKKLLEPLNVPIKKKLEEKKMLFSPQKQPQVKTEEILNKPVSFNQNFIKDNQLIENLYLKLKTKMKKKIKAKGDRFVFQSIDDYCKEMNLEDDIDIEIMLNGGLSFEKFQKNMKQFLDYHKSCGEFCNHLQKFYDRIGYRPDKIHQSIELPKTNIDGIKFENLFKSNASPAIKIREHLNTIH